MPLMLQKQGRRLEGIGYSIDLYPSSIKQPEYFSEVLGFFTFWAVLARSHNVKALV